MKMDNSKDSSVSGIWSNPGASLYNSILQENNYSALLKEAYLIAPVGRIKNTEENKTSFSASGMGYPHHVIRNGELVIHRAGLRAAYSRATQQGIVRGEVEAHLIRHYKELEWYEESNISEDELKHHGILGMRWGIRNYRGPDGKIIPGKRIPPSKVDVLKKEGGGTPTIASPTVSAPSTSTTPTSVKEMSSADLRNAIERINLEKQYTQLTAKQISPGRKAVQEVLGSSGKKIAQTLLVKYGIKGGSSIIDTLLKEGNK